MKIATVVLQWLVLVPLILTQDTCYRERQAFYYVYNANVKIDSYYCLLNDGKSSSCENVYNSKKVTNGHQDILRKCQQKQEGININVGVRVILCEVSAQINLLEKTITFASNKTCKYDGREDCFDSIVNKYVFWNYKDGCPNLIQMDRHKVDVWTIGQNKMKFIRSSRFSLLLKNKTELCGVDVWNTLYDGIIVSINYIENSVRGNLLPFEDILPKTCNATTNNAKGRKSYALVYDKASAQEKWYIYKYPASITVYYCISNYKQLCKSIQYDEISQTHQQNLLETCRNTFPNFKPMNSKVCQKTQAVNLKKDIVQDLHSNCRYSFGNCREYKAFWNCFDHCAAIQKMYEAYEIKETRTNRKMRITDSFELTLLEQGKLCDKPVWYTDQRGLVASQKELEFFQSNPITFPKEKADEPPEISQPTEKSVENIPSNNQDHLTTSEDEFNSNSNTASPLFFDQIDDNQVSIDLDIQNQEINHLQNLLYCIMFLVLVCILWYFVNVIINFVSLKKFNKTHISKNRAYLLNCFSHSLTARYLFVNEKEMKTQERSVPGINESVDNELYDMRFTKFK